MITIKPSATADTRTCDFANVSKDTLKEASYDHIEDVRKALDFFRGYLSNAGVVHDYDKITAIDAFHHDFVSGFANTDWWDTHRKIHRHHLAQEDGIPGDVNLLDVLEYVADCVMAGMARSGKVYPPVASPELLQRAFQNTVELLIAQVRVGEPEDNFDDMVRAHFELAYENPNQSCETLSHLMKSRFGDERYLRFVGWIRNGRK